MGTAFDGTWRARALAGEAAACDRLAEEALVPLYRFVLPRVGGRRELCEEVVQETLVRALRELERYDPGRSDGDPLPWLTGLARNECRAVLAREKATPLGDVWNGIDETLREVYARIDDAPLADELVQRAETRELVNAAMSQLPAHYREVLEAKYLLGESVRALAERLRLSEKAIESRLTRAREAFRATFRALAEQLHFDDPLSEVAS